MDAKRTPVIDGDTATFLWHGRNGVRVHGDFQDWRGEPLPLERAGPNLWARTLTLPRDAYVEYALFDAHGRRVRDPLNPRVSDNGFGDVNHCFYMPEGGPTPFSRRLPGVPRGQLTRHTVETEDQAVGARRAVTLYAPPVEGPVPLGVVLDGEDYLRRARLPVLVDNLIAEKRMSPVALAFVANGAEARTPEYTCSEATVRFLLNAVLPLAKRELPLLDERLHPGAHAVLGASYGGLMALFAAQRAPEVFGHVLAQSGAYSLEGWDFVVFELARRPQQRPLSVWMDCGGFEGLLEGSRRLAPLLTSAGHRVAFREYSGGHNYPAWRDDLPRGLEFIFPHSPTSHPRKKQPGRGQVR
ncbi:prolyl oligopeptidase family serine peptidase [Corallococcus sp. M34]|uniref:alpha/beta hydrolase n=1 Tax=Citreicoccus inhibens TaxID=2849499 RepID=UPI001C218928|nr:alpha/beta hydrolase-fold protein [Citreicoccus inhibens]MBU8898765.1 prolyl oligopeptidase family serine peptidase [Citreicoccus inhibens]